MVRQENLEYKDQSTFPGSIFDLNSGYHRKLPLDLVDKSIVGVVEKRLSDWKFLQVRTLNIREYLMNYIIMFETKDKLKGPTIQKLEKDIRSSKDWLNIDYSEEFIKSIGLEGVAQELSKRIKIYNLKDVKACPEVLYGCQGEAPHFFNMDYLFVRILLEDKNKKRKKLEENIKKAEENLRNVRKERDSLI